MSKLNTLLAGMLTACEAQPGVTRQMALGNGLHVEMKAVDDTIFLQIYRSSVYPSPWEWTTVLRAMPYSVDATPIARKWLGRYYLRGQFLRKPVIVTSQQELNI